jgi:hypothetical protein
VDETDEALETDTRDVPSAQLKREVREDRRTAHSEPKRSLTHGRYDREAL